jgi:hypothetical protein
VQIVNGGQTSRTLFHAYQEDPERVSHVDVLVRIVETKDRTISERISDTANRQTPISTRDLHANDWIQRKLEQDFLQKGYFYERKKNQYSDQPTDKRLDSELLAQLSLSYYFELPSEARNSKSIVFNDEYMHIFDEDVVTASRLIFPYFLYKPLELQKREIQAKKRKKIVLPDNESFISLATFHIIFAMKLIAEYENWDLSNLEQQKYARERSIQLISEIVNEEVPKRGELYTHDRFFKEKGTNQMIHDHISKYYHRKK